MNKPHRKSANQSRRSSGRSIMSNPVRTENPAEPRVISDMNIPPADIPKIKWHEILDDAEEDLVVNHIREEIIRDVMKVIYNRHLEKMSYAFVVHCSYLAWMQFFDLLYLKHDPGESVQTIAENWSYDKAPDPVPVDPWACRRMTVRKVEKESEELETCTALCSTKIAEVGSPISVPSFTYPFPEADSCIQLSVSS
ncbi:uncharacterized protein LOC125500737 [Athalia rosae]|uniref:uncharacterized protein LOC125500737 n=1 Tax=Athalia rosae TaxID=37344 RepID=UPI002034A4CF|nr:uncharacterized protein LOC125500737 [Athalia rosae]